MTKYFARLFCILLWLSTQLDFLVKMAKRPIWQELDCT